MNIHKKIIVLSALAFTSAIGQELSSPPTVKNGEAVSATPKEQSPQRAEDKLDFLKRSKEIVLKVARNERRVDPFGLPMDPSNLSTAPAFSEQYEETEDIPVLNASAFKTAIESLPVSGIYPQRETVVIGARSFSKGEQFGMKLEELTIRLRVEGIRGSSIYFKDLDTQEVAAFDFNPTPAEFEPIFGNKKQPRGPGIVPMNELFIVN